MADITLEAHDAWVADATLPEDLTRLRVALFHTVRAVAPDGPPDDDTEAWARALVSAIRGQI